MRLAELHVIDFPALWAGLSVDAQAAIGTAAIAEQFAGLVAADDGSETTATERNAALSMASEAYDGVTDATEQAFPNIAWWSE